MVKQRTGNLKIKINKPSRLLKKTHTHTTPTNNTPSTWTTLNEKKKKNCGPCLAKCFTLS